ncbi:glycosyl transferase family 2 [Candidatus Micrarchaeota archaeon CG10_big_fil_rev_8_21_14_0_10_45_29]|nr:MAG: glycosyl transferase family 2 [Candidatus Micrarchaeota archaeon CG10_big_fil_rev_8_21_14_0_10_45_29]
MLKIVIPMAGLGSRFKEAGYTFPKPLIEINGKPMIEVVANNLRPGEEHQFIFVCLQEHLEKYNLADLLRQISPDCKIVPIQGVTQGAACTVLLASQYINSEDEVVIANSDQFVDVKLSDFVKNARENSLDGLIMTFNSHHPKWSYAKLDEGGFVCEVAEKKPISSNATVGIYYFRHGKMFVNAAQEMIRKDIRTNNEFYVCPVYNELVLSGNKIKVFPIDFSQMHGLGTPEDLNNFLKTENSKKV